MTSSPEQVGSLPSTVVVTGGAGFVGSRAVEMMAPLVQRVVVLDVADSPRAQELAALPNVEFRVIDLRDVEALEPIVADADAIVHLAAVRTIASASRPSDAHDINVSATYELLKLATRHHVGRLIYSSSNTVYGSYQNPHAAPYREDHPWVPHGINMYAATKLASEAYLEAFAGLGGADYLSLRIGPVYGPRVTPDSNGSSVVQVLRAYDRGERPALSWTRESVLSFVHVDDVARAFAASLTATETRVAVNVVGEPLAAEYFYSTLAELYGRDPAELNFTGARSRYQYVSQDRMREVLGFVPDTPLIDGFQSVIDWHRSLSLAS